MRGKKLALLVLVVVVLLVSSVAQAAGTGDIAPNVQTGDPGLSGNYGLQTIVEFFVKITRFAMALAGVLLTLAFIFFGFRLKFAADPRRRAEAVEGLMYAIIGGLIVFGAGILASVLRSFVASI